MTGFLLTVIAALVVAGIGFGAVAFTLGLDRGLAEPRPDGLPFDLPADRPLAPSDIEELRLDTALRGYRMAQVDDVLARAAHDLGQLADRVYELETALAHRSTERVTEPVWRTEALNEPVAAGFEPTDGELLADDEPAPTSEEVEPAGKDESDEKDEPVAPPASANGATGDGPDDATPDDATPPGPAGGDRVSTGSPAARD